MAMLQRSAGNAAVAGMVGSRGKSGPGESVGPGGASAPGMDTVSSAAVPTFDLQRAVGPGASTAPPVPPSAPNPKADPKFTAVAGAAKSAGQQLKKHPTPAQEVGKAQAAAKGPGDDKACQAKAVQVDKMAAAKPGGFDKVAFVAAVKKAIAAAAPKNLDEADKFATSGKADSVKGEVMSKVTQGKETSAKSVKEESTKAPDPSAGVEKPVTPLAPEPAPPQPAVNGAAAMPAPAPAEQVNFAGGPADVDATMKDAQVTEEHLKKSNEPQLQEAAAAKKEAEVQSAAAPKAIRQSESQALNTAQTGAGADAKKALGAMTKDKAGAMGRIAGAKNDTKTKDEVERAKISGEINQIFDKTKSDVEAILNGLDGKVTAEFDKGEAQARSEFTAKHKADMEKYKDKRYSGPAGWVRWGEDLFAGLPAEANKIYDDAKALYESKMTVVINNVADLIGKELDAAKARIATGRQQIKDYIASKPANLQKLAAEASKDMSGKFDQLDSDVDAKQQPLVDDLASKYVEARGKVDEEIKAEQESNKGLVAKAKDAVMGAVDTILKLKALFMGLLSKAAAAFTKILDDPIKFISNFMSAVKQGFMSFAGNILTHLRKGLLGWLFGALANAGIELPDTFDLKGILKLVGSILGLTWTNIKARIIKIAPWVGKVIDVIESKIEVFKILATQGVAGLWNWIKQQLGNLKEMILTPIKDFVVEKIVTAGISWVLGMLNPAGALVKVAQALIGVVQWIMERGAALMDFVGTVIDAVSDIANGGVGGVPAKIEAALGKAVPLVIAFLANLLGLGGISDKIKAILKAVQAPINKALDFVIKGALKLAGPLIKGIKGIGGKMKAKIAAGKAWVKGKAEAGKAWVKGKVETGKAWVKGKGAAVASKVREIKDAFLAKLMGKKSVTMKGKQHSVFLEVQGGKHVVMMASDKDRLVNKIFRALKDDEVTKNAELVGHLKGIQLTVKKYEDDIVKYKFVEPNAKKARDLEGNLEGYSGQMISQLAEIGRALDLDVLKGGKYVLDDHVHPDYVKSIRRTFYGTASYEHLRSAKRQEAIDNKLLRYPNPMDYPDMFWCPGYLGGKPPRYPHLALLSSLHLDHKEGAASHWKREGHNSTQKIREDFYIDGSKIEALCSKCNGAKQSEGDHYDSAVGPGFSGPGGLR